MQVASERVSTESVTKITTPPLYPLCCPACGGPLLELRATLRCARCYFSICDTCAGDLGERTGNQGE